MLRFTSLLMLFSAVSVFLPSQQLFAQTYLISDQGTITTCTGTIYDSGGANGDYQNNENYTMTICSEVPDGCLQLDFLVFDIESGWDEFFIYAGSDASGVLIAELTGNIDPGIISTGTSCITLVFTTDGSVTDVGFEIAITCVCPTCDDGIQNGQELAVDCGGPDCPECDFIVISEEDTYTTCNSIIFDSGISGNYGNNEEYVITVCAEDTAACFSLDFLVFDIENFFDSLIVYEGVDQTGDILGAYTGNLDAFSLLVPGDCVTLRFSTDGSVTRPGFEIAVNCVCPTCDDGILNGQEVATDCGGPDCPECDFLVIDQGGIVNTCNQLLYDTGILGNYGVGEDTVLTVCSNSLDSCLVLEFNELDIQFGDHLYIYDGFGIDGFLIADITNSNFQTPITAPSGCVTFHFTSDGFGVGGGFEIDISCTVTCPTCVDGIQNGYEIGVDCGGPDCPECDFVIMGEGPDSISTCSTIIFDNGFQGPYANNSDDVLTVCSDTPGECIQAAFLFFEVENIIFDQLDVYAGSSMDAPLIGSYGGGVPPPGIINAGTECLTFHFTSDGSVTPQGFEIEISCVCPTCDDGILNGQEIATDCGGPDCPECDFLVIDQGGIVNTCNQLLYDSGISGNYGIGEDNELTVCSNSLDSCLVLEFNELDIQFGDHLYIYDGFGIDGFLIADITNSNFQTPITAPSGCVTFHFTSDGFGVGGGFEIDISCTVTCPTCVDGIQNGYEIGVDCGGPDCPECDFVIMGEGPDSISTCSTIIFDNGFQGPYANNSDDVLTVCSDTPGECIQAAFLFFEVENIIFDQLDVYAGSSMGAPLIGSYGGGVPPPNLIDAGTECLTFHFTSDGSVTPQGFEIEISCGCPSCDDGILNGQEVATDCGGPDCPSCDFNVISEEVTITSCEATLFDSGIEGNYGVNEDFSMTFCADNTDQCLVLDFIDVGIGVGDHLYIYDGEGIDGILIADITATAAQEDIFSPGSCVTFQFISDAFGTGIGFEIDINCSDLCPSCDDGIQNGLELDIDCGGPDCPACDFMIISQEIDVTTCEGTAFDSGLGLPYQNNEDYTMTICSDDSVSCLGLDFISFDTEGFFDHLDIYYGTEVSGLPVQSFTGSLGAFLYESTVSCLTLNWISDASVTSQGFEFDIVCGDCPQPTEQDCLGANEVCEFIYEQESYPPDQGNFPVTLTPDACLDNAENAIWYTFTVQGSGNLSFILTPQNEEDDYDWGLFDLSNASCADISSNPSLLVSCNSYGQFGINGPTGISTDQGGIGNVNGPGDLNGPPFNADYPVTVGQTYALLVQNWTGSFDGYTLDFTETTAGIFYPGGPDIESVDFNNCGEISLVLSEPIDCSTLQPEDFELTTDIQVYTVDSILSDCDDLEQTTSVTLFVNPLFGSMPESLEINFNPDQGLILDLCGNPVPIDTVYSFETPQWISIVTEVLPTECLDAVGSVQILQTFGGVDPLTYTFDGEAISVDLLVEGLAVGEYDIAIEDAIGCTFEQTAIITSEIEEISLVMPNVFSPNGDEMNPLFGPKAFLVNQLEDLGLVDVDQYLDNYELVVWNRWGKLVFSSSNSARFWDGQDGADAAPEGTYFYKVRFREACSLVDFDIQEYSGSVTLVR